MWNDLSAYLCGCVDPVDESPRHVHLTREYDDDSADATSREDPRRHPADAGRAGARRLVRERALN